MQAWLDTAKVVGLLTQTAAMDVENRVVFVRGNNKQNELICFLNLQI
jgi:hypothetical protein